MASGVTAGGHRRLGIRPRTGDVPMSTDSFGMSDDADLVREVAAGSQEALSALYDRHVDGVFAAARRITRDRQVAEEVVQETFLALWNRAELYKQRAGSLAAWLHTIARNRAIDRMRAAGRRPRLVPLSRATHESETDETALDRLEGTGTAVGGSAPPPDPEAAAVSAWARQQIREALAEMPEEERTVIVLAYDQELSQSEIAVQLGWPVGTVKTRTRRALGRLRGVLAATFDEERPGERTAIAAGGRTDGSR
jgi:RNA polymerase sigma-70 factor (ECF subfamily)